MSNALQAALLERAKREQDRRSSVTTGQPLQFSQDVMPPAPDQTLLQKAGGVAGDVAGAFGAGVSRGITGIMDAPAALQGAANAAAAKLGQAAGLPDDFVTGLGMSFGYSEPESLGRFSDLASDVSGGATDYKGETRLGRVAGTVGEFAPAALATGGASLPALMSGAVVPGVGSELAGEAFEGTEFENAARIVGAVAANPVAATGKRLATSAVTPKPAMPTIESLRQARTQAYKAAEDAGITFAKKDVNRIITRASKALDDANFVAETDKQAKAAFEVLSRQANKPLTLQQLDKLRQHLWTRYNADNSQVAILDMIDAIDDTIQSNVAGGALMSNARLANARYKKAELLDDALVKAADQTSHSGSGGNIANKYRQAVTAIVNNPKKAKWFSKDEIAAMRSFIHPGTAENALRRIGKVAPGGNGLMTALNIGAIVADPAMIAVTAGATAAKGAADRSAMRGAEELQRMLATGALQQSRPSAMSTIPAALPGLMSTMAPQEIGDILSEKPPFTGIMGAGR